MAGEQDPFKLLADNITEQVLQKVQQQVHQVVSSAVATQINNMISGDDVLTRINTRIDQTLHGYTPDLTEFTNSLNTVGQNIIAKLNTEANQLVTAAVNDKINSIDLDTLILQQITRRLDPSNNQYPFMDNSIPGSAVNTENLQVSGSNITGGTIKQFSSTGIEDQASQCQVTVLDQGTIFENTLYAPHIEIKGGAVIDGDLDIQGRIVEGPAYRQLVNDIADVAKSEITGDVLDQHQDRILEKLLAEGIDLSKITLSGRTIIDGNKLLGVVHSQLQSVGQLHDLQTVGETLLSETLYVGNKRMGINTMSPNMALSVWDEEIEIGIGKRSKDVAEISSDRAALVLSSNNHTHVTLLPDGVTEIAKLRIGNMLFSSAPTPPHYDAVKGTVVFNENPNLGGPLGWVSLGDARWANFGIID